MWSEIEKLDILCLCVHLHMCLCAFVYLHTLLLIVYVRKVVSLFTCEATKSTNPKMIENVSWKTNVTWENEGGGLEESSLASRFCKMDAVPQRRKTKAQDGIKGKRLSLSAVTSRLKSWYWGYSCMIMWKGDCVYSTCIEYVMEKKTVLVRKTNRQRDNVLYGHMSLQVKTWWYQVPD